MATNRWWANDPAERYFVETTERPDIGTDLRAPQATDSGQENHQAYVLIKETRRDDIVLHYDKPSRRIAAWSRVAGDLFPEDIIWGAHGTVARQAGVEPYRRPGWRVLLEGPYTVTPAVTLEELRARETDVRAAFATVRAAHRGSLYLPFELSDKRALRPTQNYLTKAPLSWVNLFPQLAAIPAQDARRTGPSAAGPTGVGQEYVAADENAATSERDPFSVDPSLVDRALRGHSRTQNALAKHIGDSARRPRPEEPQYDLAWHDGADLYVAEVKSLTSANEERQLRLGLGQVLRYAQLLRAAHGRRVTPVLAVEREPQDRTWRQLCDTLQVRLVWPPSFEGLRD